MEDFENEYEDYGFHYFKPEKGVIKLLRSNNPQLSKREAETIAIKGYFISESKKRYSEEEDIENWSVNLNKTTNLKIIDKWYKDPKGIFRENCFREFYHKGTRRYFFADICRELYTSYKKEICGGQYDRYEGDIHFSKRFLKKILLLETHKNVLEIWFSILRFVMGFWNYEVQILGDDKHFKIGSGNFRAVIKTKSGIYIACEVYMKICGKNYIPGFNFIEVSNRYKDITATWTTCKDSVRPYLSSATQ